MVLDPSVSWSTDFMGVLPSWLLTPARTRGSRKAPGPVVKAGKGGFGWSGERTQPTGPLGSFESRRRLSFSPRNARFEKPEVHWIRKRERFQVGQDAGAIADVPVERGAVISDLEGNPLSPVKVNSLMCVGVRYPGLRRF
jgi:hypothetical protein